ncbi:MAG TPA: type II toxin-antitoxin system VapB family antitoxin [Gemmatimonadaceae bacterium]
MPLSIKSPEADRLARELADETGESLTDAVILALRERLERQRGRRARARLAEDIARIQARYRRLPIQDARSAEEILDYDVHGLPR